MTQTQRHFCLFLLLLQFHKKSALNCTLFFSVHLQQIWACLLAWRLQWHHARTMSNSHCEKQQQSEVDATNRLLLWRKGRGYRHTEPNFLKSSPFIKLRNHPARIASFPTVTTGLFDRQTVGPIRLWRPLPTTFFLKDPFLWLKPSIQCLCSKVRCVVVTWHWGTES